MNRDERPLVSVIIPVYNVEKYLKDCVDSVLSQTYINLEVILVDDGSPDSSGDMCDNFAKEDSRIKVVHKENEGLNFARKSGFENSTGQWIAFVDSDDVIDGRYIEALLSANQLHGTELSICAFKSFVDKIDKDENILINRLEDIEETTRLYLMDSRPEGKYFLQTAWAKLFSRRIIEAVDWSFSDYRSNEDELMSIYYYKDLATGVSFVDNHLYYYRKNPDSIMAKAKIEYRNTHKGKEISRLDFLEDVYWKRFETFGEKYSNEIAYFFSMHFMVHINKEHRKDSKYRLSEKEAALYNDKLEFIRNSRQYTYHDEYQAMYEAIQEKGDVRAFFEYREGNPLISIVIPVYNAEAYLKECLDSIMTQSYYNLEVILVDDGSTDSSGDLCDEYAQSDERIQVIHRQNGGVSAARNSGIIEALGEYVVFVDSDDFMEPFAIDSLVNGWRKTERKADILIGDVTPYHTLGYSDKAPIRNIPARSPFSVKSSTAEELYALLTTVNSAFGKAFRRDLLTRQGLTFPENIRIAEDLDFVVKSFFSAKELYYIDEPIYFYRTDYQNESSAIGRVSKEKAFDFGIALKSINEFLQRSGYLDRPEVVEALHSAVAAHSLYALNVVEKSHKIHREVFNYIKNDLFKYFKTNHSVSHLSKDDQNKVSCILRGDYESYLMARIHEFRYALFNRLDAIGVMDAELQSAKRDFGALSSKVESLSGEIAYLKSIRGMVRSPLGRVARRFKRMLGL